MNNPFIYKFQILNGNKYIYDVNTNQFLKVNEIVFNIIDDFANHQFKDILSKWSSIYTKNELERAFRTIVYHNNRGYFSCHRPTKMTFPFCCDKHLVENLSTKIGQVIIEITQECNLRCHYCIYSGSYRYERSHSKQMMSKSTLRKVLNYYLSHSKKADIHAISFYGGEPLMAFNLIKYAIDYTNGIVPNGYCLFKIDTNGTLLKRDIIEFIVSHGIILQISLDGPQNIHDKYRRDIRGYPTYAKIMSNLKFFRKINKSAYERNVKFQCTLTPDYDLFALNEFFEKHTFVNGIGLTVTFVNPFDTTFYNGYNEDIIKQHRSHYQ